MRLIKGFGAYLGTWPSLSGAQVAVNRRFEAQFLQAAFCRSGCYPVTRSQNARRCGWADLTLNDLRCPAQRSGAPRRDFSTVNCGG